MYSVVCAMIVRQCVCVCVCVCVRACVHACVRVTVRIRIIPVCMYMCKHLLYIHMSADCLHTQCRNAFVLYDLG